MTGRQRTVGDSSTPMDRVNNSGKRKRLDGGSPELDNSFSEEERVKMEDAVKKVSDMIAELVDKVRDKSKKYKLQDIIKEVEKLGAENETSLVGDVLPMLTQDKSRKIDFLLERQYCNRCEIEISREEEEKKLIIEKVGEGESMLEEEYSKFLDLDWPQEAYITTKLVTGNVLSFQGDELIIFVENNKEESSLMGLVKNRFPEVGEVLAEEEEGDDSSLPYLENIVNTKKGTTKKRIYFLEVGIDKEVKRKLIKFRDEKGGQARDKLSVAVSTFKHRERIRKALEVIFFQENFKINFYVPDSDLQRGRDVSKTRGGRQRSEAVVIDTNVSTYADTLRNIRAVVDLEKLGIEVKTVKATKDKRMVIVTEEGQAETLHREISAKVTGVETRVTGRGRERYTPLLILDIDASINGKEVEDAIRKTTKVYETQIKSLRIGRSGTQIAVVHMPAKEAEELLGVGDIKIGWTRCRVKPKIDVLKCFNCLKLGHHSDICREEKSERRCLNCAQVGHMIRDCNNSSFCTMCNKEGHRSDSTHCPSYRMRFQEATDQWQRNNGKQGVVAIQNIDNNEGDRDKTENSAEENDTNNMEVEGEGATLNK